MKQKIALIIGAGPAGLTAAYELLEKTDIKPIIYEMSSDIGGISKTINYKGNRMDIGGHRFFSKSDRVMKWWLNILPSENDAFKNQEDLNPDKIDKIMLIRNRLSRIFFLRSFFDYPISLKWSTFKNLGLLRIFRIGFSYIKVRLLPIKNEKNLEDFFINRFGNELYKTFFKDYTQKVWGVPCDEIKPEWGAQRIKGLSITKTVLHAFKSLFNKDSSIDQKNTETSLIEQFMYPKFGPGQLWEEVAQKIIQMGGEIHFNSQVVKIKMTEDKIASISFKNIDTNTTEIKGDYLFSTMPVKELCESMIPSPPNNVLKVSSGLMYRDFITVGVLLKKMKIKNDTNTTTDNNIVPDNWIYIQERDVKLGRLQIFNNWSPYMVKDFDTIWIGLEYFCNEGDELWSKSDEAFIKFAIDELDKIDIIKKEDVLDSTLVRVPKTYPAYFGTYDDFHIIKDFTNKIENLFLVGRNGMHKYNNADHSMLTAMIAVENIINNDKSKDNIWQVNVEEEYHEKK